jgi:hypothetical protein
MAAKKTVINKAEWIRKHPGTPASELIALAKKEGITISAAQVYTTRSDQKKKAGGARAKRGPGRPAAQSGSGGALGVLEGPIRAIIREEIKAILGKL